MDRIPLTFVESKRQVTDMHIGGNNPIKKKVDKMVASKLHNDLNFLRTMDYVAPLVTELDMHTERRVMRQLERRELDLNRNYLKEFEKEAFSPVNSQVQQFVEKVRVMHRICSDLTNRIQQNKEKTQDLLSKTSTLQHQKRVLESKQKSIDDFLIKFSLTDSEEKELDGRAADGTVSSDFFSAMAHVKEIHNNSKHLLRTSGEHSAALEIMEEMSQKLEKAYEVLYRSIQSDFMIGEMIKYCLSTHLVSISFRYLMNSTIVLYARKVFVEYIYKDMILELICVIHYFLYQISRIFEDEFCTARKNKILRLYIDALTKGAHGSGKPIELMSHDPLRYVGDMLAWMYEAIEGEEELIQMLLKNCNPQVLENNLVYMLGLISSALCRPSEIGVNSELAQTISELNQLALNIFYSGLNNAVQKILAKVWNKLSNYFVSFLISIFKKYIYHMGAPDYDLLPVQAVHQILMLLRDVLETHEGAMTGQMNSKEEFNKIFGYVLDPLYRAIHIAATQLHSPLDVAVYTLNCLSAIHSIVILYQFTDTRLEKIKALNLCRTGYLIEGNEDVLISEEASAILANTGLIQLYQKAVAHDESQGPLSAIAGMSSAIISRVLTQFDVFLSQPDSYRLDQIAKISSARIRDAIHQRTVDNVVAAYSLIVQKLDDPSNKYEGISFKTVEQVYLLKLESYLLFKMHLGGFYNCKFQISRCFNVDQDVKEIMGRKLENYFGSRRFIIMLGVFSIASTIITVGLSILLDKCLDFGYMDQCALLSPNVSFVGHLAGIIAGVLYLLGPLKVMIDAICDPFEVRQFNYQPSAPTESDSDIDDHSPNWGDVFRGRGATVGGAAGRNYE
uniref:Conserved oligomeric Golgi complex subunit 6 n=1 Tax=Heterorhabditis bacteriophora TaxID=37862 RepID=A0A1I7XUJ7_HETBA